MKESIATLGRPKARRHPQGDAVCGGGLRKGWPGPAGQRRPEWQAGLLRVADVQVVATRPCGPWTSSCLVPSRTGAWEG